jgi:hypothetical protein
MTSGGAARMGPWTLTGGGAGGGGTARSWTSRGRGGAIIRLPLSAHARDDWGCSEDGTVDVNRRRHWRRRDDPIVDVAGELWRNNLTAVLGPCML